MTTAAQILTFAAALRLMVRVKTAWQTARAAAPADKPVHLHQFSRWLLPALSPSSVAAVSDRRSSLSSLPSCSEPLPPSPLPPPSSPSPLPPAPRAPASEAPTPGAP
jgi:hypothetical protein